MLNNGERAFMYRILVAGIVLSASSPAIAAVVVDQSALVPASGSAAVTRAVGNFLNLPVAGVSGPSNIGVVQTFTAGSRGILNRIDFQFGFTGYSGQSSDNIYTFTLIDGDYASGARSALISQLYTLADFSTLTQARNASKLVTFDVSGAEYAVTPGQRYSVLFAGLTSFELGSPSAGPVIGYGGLPTEPPAFGGSNYAGGSYYQITNGFVSPPSTVYDVGFISYISPAIPEPATWAMMLFGFAAAGAAMRHGNRDRKFRLRLA